MKLKSKKLIIIIILLQLVVNVYLIAEKESFQNVKEEISIPVRKHEKALSMMLETEAGSGNYELTTASSWPTEGYIFNSTLSKCENGGELLWDDTTKKVVFNGATSDKCYVYFDVKSNPTFTIIDLDSTEKTYTFEEGMTWKTFLSSDYAENIFSSGCQGSESNRSIAFSSGISHRGIAYVCNTSYEYDYVYEQDAINEGYKYYIKANRDPCPSVVID